MYIEHCEPHRHSCRMQKMKKTTLFIEYFIILCSLFFCFYISTIHCLIINVVTDYYHQCTSINHYIISFVGGGRGGTRMKMITMMTMMKVMIIFEQYSLRQQLSSAQHTVHADLCELLCCLSLQLQTQLMAIYMTAMQQSACEKKRQQTHN